MDIVEQLRKSANIVYQQDGYTFRLGLQYEAANEIERLRGENYELKDLLQCTVNYTGASVSSNRFTFHAALKEGE